MSARIPALAAVLVTIAEPALANVIWPAAILTERLLAWWVIGASLLIEFLFVWRAFRLSPLNAAFATIAANAASAAIGFFALPMAGILWEAGLHVSGLGIRLGWETFSPAGWAITFVLAVALSLGIELAVYRFGFRLPMDRRIVILLLVANAITAGLAWASLGIVPHDFY